MAAGRDGVVKVFVKEFVKHGVHLLLSTVFIKQLGGQLCCDYDHKNVEGAGGQLVNRRFCETVQALNLVLRWSWF